MFNCIVKKKLNSLIVCRVDKVNENMHFPLVKTKDQITLNGLTQ